ILAKVNKIGRVASWKLTVFGNKSILPAVIVTVVNQFRHGRLRQRVQSFPQRPEAFALDRIKNYLDALVLSRGGRVDEVPRQLSKLIRITEPQRFLKGQTAELIKSIPSHQGLQSPFQIS